MENLRRIDSTVYSAAVGAALPCRIDVVGQELG